MMLGFPAIIWAAVMVMMLAGFILFTLWQRMKSQPSESDELDLETYHKLKNRDEWLARVRMRPEQDTDSGSDEHEPEHRPDAG